MCSTRKGYDNIIMIIFLVAIILYYIEELRLRVVTIATSETDGYQRFIRSARLFDLDVEVGALLTYMSST